MAQVGLVYFSFQLTHVFVDNDVLKKETFTAERKSINALLRKLPREKRYQRPEKTICQRFGARRGDFKFRHPVCSRVLMYSWNKKKPSPGFLISQAI